MGSKNRPEEQPLHLVQVTSFDMATTEVTVRQFRAFVQATGYQTDAERVGHSFVCCWRPKIGVNWREPGFAQADDEPVVAVSWNDAVAFATWLSEETGEGYRLPSEAEWEYACKAGGDGRHGQLLTEIGWYNENSEGHTHPVGKKKPNAWGLNDLLGNAWEWCQDVYHASYQGAPADGSAWMTGGATNQGGYTEAGKGRILRGGAWGLCDCKHPVGYELSPSSRPVFNRDSACNNSGFRLARTIPPPGQDTISNDEPVPPLCVRGLNFETIVLPAACFRMGSRDGDSTERPEHPVGPRFPVRMGRTEVTVRQFRLFAESTSFLTDAERRGWAWDSNFRRRQVADRKNSLSWRNPGFVQRDDHPVTCVSWNDATAFCRWLAKESGRRVRLPSEAEWEYACRYQVPNSEPPKLAEIAWYARNSEFQTHPVGSKRPNALGVYDLLGNVAEWVEDLWHPNYAGAPPDGSSWLGDQWSTRVCRGGAFERESNEMGPTGRDWYDPSEAIVGNGFRIVDATCARRGK